MSIGFARSNAREAGATSLIEKVMLEDFVLSPLCQRT
jgi:hypothetical protein